MKGTIRQRLTFSVVCVTAVMLALLVVGFNLSLRASLDGDVDRLLHARAQATLDNIDLENGKLRSQRGIGRRRRRRWSGSTTTESRLSLRRLPASWIGWRPHRRGGKRGAG